MGETSSQLGDAEETNDKTLEEGRNEYTVARQLSTESGEGTVLSDFIVQECREQTRAQELGTSRFCGIGPAFDSQDLSFLICKVE